MVKSLWELSVEEEEQSNADAVTQTVTDTLESSDNTEQIEELASNMDSDVSKLQDQQELSEQVADKVDQLDAIIEKPDDEITNDDIEIAQEAIFFTLSKLGYSKQDILLLRPSNESYNNKKSYIVLSRESIWETLKQLGSSIWKLLVDLGRQMRVIIQKIITACRSRNGMVAELMSVCSKNADKPMKPIDQKLGNKVMKYFYTFIRCNKDIIDMDYIINFVTNNEHNPFIHNIENLYTVIKDAQSGKTENNKVNVDKIREESLNVAGQKQMIEHLKSSTDVEYDVLYVYSVKGHKIKMYTKAGDDSKLGIKSETYDYKFDNKNHKLHINKVKTLGDFTPYLKKLLQVFESANSYLSVLNEYNSKATKYIKEFTNNVKDGSDSDIDKALITNGANLIRDIGSNLMFNQMSSYMFNTTKLLWLCNVIIKNTMAEKKEEEKK